MVEIDSRSKRKRKKKKSLFPHNCNIYRGVHFTHSFPQKQKQLKLAAYDSNATLQNQHEDKTRVLLVQKYL